MTDAIEIADAPPALESEALPAVRPELSPEQLLKLAREIAMDIRELPTILAGFSLSTEQFTQHIEQNPYFKRALEAYRIEWNSALSTRDRIRIQAGTALEEALPKLGARLTKSDESLDAQVKGAALFAKLAGAEEQKTEGAGEKFSITINLGADTQLRYEKDVAPKTATPPNAVSIPTLLEGEALPAPVRQVSKAD